MKPKITLLRGKMGVNIQNVLHFHQTTRRTCLLIGGCYMIILADPNSTDTIQEIWPKSCITGLS